MSEQWSNASIAPRSGEAIDTIKLGQWLISHHPEMGGGIAVRQYPSGFSNLTYAVTIGQTECILRRPPFGSEVATAHDMSREYRILVGLAKTYDKAPRPLAYCESPEVLGAPFYLMEKKDGLILRGTRAVGTTPALMDELSRGLVQELKTIHTIDLDQAGLATLGRPAGYVGRQIRGWTRRWASSRPAPNPQLDRIAQWLVDHEPAEAGACLIHNDFKYDNLVLSADDTHAINGVLDWEMATLGCPLMDVGTSLGYWIEGCELERLGSLPFGPTAMDGNLSRMGVWQSYCEASRRSDVDPLFYYLYGVFKVGVILAQIHKRYAEGKTTDSRFATLDDGVRRLASNGVRALELGRISDLW